MNGVAAHVLCAIIVIIIIHREPVARDRLRPMHTTNEMESGSSDCTPRMHVCIGRTIIIIGIGPCAVVSDLQQATGNNKNRSSSTISCVS